MHRSELTVQEQADHIAEWVRITTAAQSGEQTVTPTPAKPVQPEQVSQGGRGNQGGVALAARKLDLPRSKVTRALKIASLDPRAREAASEAGLSDNEAALLRAASQPTPDAQIATLRLEATKVRTRKTRAPDPLKAFLKRAEDAWIEGYTRLFNAAGDEYLDGEAPP